MKRFPLYLLWHSIFTTLFTWLLMHIVFSDLFLHQRISFVRFAETEYNFYGLFTLVSNWFHGGIQLWNPYDHMPLTYYYFTGGIAYASNILTGIVYVVSSFFSSSPSETFNLIYSKIYYVPSLFFISAGTLLLTQLFTKNRIILFLVPLIATTLLIPQIYLGLAPGNQFSMFPLTMYLLFQLVKTYRFKYLILTIVLLIATIMTNPLFGFGYYYLGLHLFILSVLGWQIVKLLRNKEILLKFRFDFSRVNKKMLLLPFFTCAVILLPLVHLLVTTFSDYSLGSEANRFSSAGPFNTSGYFSLPAYILPLTNILTKMVDFADNRWAITWVYHGVSTFFLLLLGLLSKDKRKYIFIAAALLIWLLNIPKEAYFPLTIAHWLTVLTNPFGFIARSMHMTSAFLLPFIYIPLIALGFKVAIEGVQKFTWIQLLIVFGIIFSVINPFQTGLQRNPRIYFTCALAGVFFILFVTRFINRPKLTIVGLFALVALDLGGLSYYLGQIGKRLTIIPYNLNEQEFLLDHQNPRNLPLRQTMRTEAVPKIPYYVYNGPNNNEGEFYRYTDLSKFMGPASQYKPKHKQYENFESEVVLYELVRQQNHFLYTAELAIPYSEANAKQLIANQALNRTIQISSPPPREFASIYHTEYATASGTAQLGRAEEFVFDLSKAKKVKEKL